jgi:hypothetical protein
MTMKRLALISGLVLIGAGLAFTQIDPDPWWHPLNPKGQSRGVTYGTVLPTFANTGNPPTDGLLAVQILEDSAPTLNIFNQDDGVWMYVQTALLDNVTPNLSQFFFPTAAGLPETSVAAEDALAADFQVVCYRAYLPYPVSPAEVVMYEFQVAAAGATDYIGFAIYDDADDGIQRAEGASVYAADGAPLVIDLGDDVIYPGWYRFCACQNDVSAQDWLAIAQTATVTAVFNETVSEIRYGLATNACTGNADMPDTTGALASTAEDMFVAQLQSN